MESTLNSRYDVIEPLSWSIGEFAPAAYKARETSATAAKDGLGRIVLLRQMPSQADTPEVRAASEQYAALPLHPNILTHYGLVDSPEGTDLPPGHYAVSEWARGISLKERIRRVAPFSLAVALDVSIAVTQALIRAQALGIEHGDLRPEEILLTPDGQVKVADFALGRAVRESSGSAIIPPSPTRAVALLMYEMLTAQPASGTGQLSPRVINAGVPPAVDGIVQKATTALGSAGYPSLGALLADLQTAREDARTGKPLTWNPMSGAAPPLRQQPQPRAGVLSQAADELVREEQSMAGAATNGPGKGRAPRSPIVDESYYDEDYPPAQSASSVWLRRLLMLFVGVVVIGVVFACAYFAMLVSSVPSDITVPNLIGKQFTDAQAIADQQHFKLVQTGHDYSDMWPQGAIYQQTPTSGRSIKAGKDVGVVVSDGPRLLDVPDLSQMTITKARAMLQDSGLPVGSINEQYDSIVPKGIVTAQTPAAGSKISRETAINLTVSKGPPPPPAPTNLSATTTIPGEVDLAWDAVAVASTYNVYRDGRKVASALPQTTYSDVGLGDATGSHTYSVTAVNSNGESPQAQPVTATSQPLDTAAGQPDTSGATPDQTAAAPPPSVATTPGAPKQRQFQVRFRIPRSGSRHNVQIEVQDATGTNVVYDEDRYRGDVVNESFQGFGNKVIFRIFLDGKLVKQQTK